MLGPLIGAAGSLFGGLLGASSASEAREAAAREAQLNRDLQKEFAQSGIQWRVEDAKKAGIHPIYALGGSGASYSPVSSNFTADMSMPKAMASMGQDLSRAFNVTRTQAQRDSAFSETMQGLQLEGQKLDNDLKRTAVASSVQRLKQNANPPMPDALGPIGVEKKHDDIPKMILGNDAIVPDRGTTNMQKFSDRYGDEGIPSWLIPPFIMWNDYRATSSFNLDRAAANPFHIERRDPVGKWWDNYLQNWRRERELGSRSGWR